MSRIIPTCLALALLTGCSQQVWVKDGATQADFEVDEGACLSASSRIPSNPRVASIGGGYTSPRSTTCSVMGPCVNIRDQVFAGCMYLHGWSFEER